MLIFTFPMPGAGTLNLPSLCLQPPGDSDSCPAVPGNGLHLPLYICANVLKYHWTSTNLLSLFLCFFLLILLSLFALHILLSAHVLPPGARCLRRCSEPPLPSSTEVARVQAEESPGPGPCFRATQLSQQPRQETARAPAEPRESHL